ncbi:MAG: T9SS type A sorting domain-containing protein [Bacteroidota bacterium]
MKHKYFALLMISVFFLPGSFIQAQIVDCTPDETVVDTAEPGQVEPDTFPPAYVDEYYEQTVTIIPPQSFDGYPIIHSIIIDSVTNLPPGVNWGKNTEEFLVTVPDTHYCVDIYGTPDEAGDYQLSLYITPYVDIGTGPSAAEQQVDDTSMMIHVLEEESIEDLTHDFSLCDIYPNPFTNNTTIQFETGTKGMAKLKVYNILGKLLYKEEKQAMPGSNQFDFSGNHLAPGTYIFSLALHDRKETSRLIKTR